MFVVTEVLCVASRKRQPGMWGRNRANSSSSSIRQRVINIVGLERSQKQTFGCELGSRRHGVRQSTMLPTTYARSGRQREPLAGLDEERARVF